MLLVVSTTGFVLQCLLFLCTAPFDRHRLVAGWWFRACARLCIKASWLWQFAVAGPRTYPLVGGAVVVSNHESHLDAFLICGLGWEMKWLAKRSLFRIPVIGWSMWLAGDVAIVRGLQASAARAMHKLQQYLAAGVPVCLFPEGTRAVAADLRPFKLGAFHLALTANVPVLPLALTGTRAALTKYSWRFGRSRALVKVGTPIDVQAVKLACALPDGSYDAPRAAQMLAELAREQIVAMRAVLIQALNEDAPHAATAS